MLDRLKADWIFAGTHPDVKNSGRAGWRIGERMSRTTNSWKHITRTLRKPCATSGFLIAVILCRIVSAQNAQQPANSPFSMRATHLLGFQEAKSNAKGNLSIQDNALQFQDSKKPSMRVKIASVQDVFLGEQSKQVGGLPMTLGKAATPYGGGRVVSLFAHKNYDTLTLEYVDADGGFHGAIFQLEKGQAELFRNALVTSGAHLNGSANEPAKLSTTEVSSDNK
jgi:hypothetical protein